MGKSLLIFIIVYSLIILNSCSKDNSNDLDNTNPIVISLLSQDDAQIGEIISIYGSNFGKVRGSNRVEFNGTPAFQSDYISWCDTIIKIVVPDGATTGRIIVYVDSKASNSINFIVNEPIVRCVIIQKGSFSMGDDNGKEWDKPSHKVTISYNFAMSKYEITQQQWEIVYGFNPSQTKGDDLPVNQVRWYQVLKFCNNLSKAENRDTCYVFNEQKQVAICNFDANGYRLPTEAEWEYACRAGKTGKFSGTGNIDEMGWYVSNTNSLKEVGLKQPNDWDLYDLHGNVAEWCWDSFDALYYDKKVENDPRIDPDFKNLPEVVIRGGGYEDDPNSCTSAVRIGLSPTQYSFYLGFRVVRKK
jgi:formylglycine-generating enzyme required for sulfatase activity